MNPEPWRVLAPIQYESRTRLPAKRGLIYDRQHNVLAMDLPSYTLAADPQLIKDIDQTARAVAGGTRRRCMMDLLGLFEKSVKNSRAVLG